MRQASQPIPLAYGIHLKRRVTGVPVAVAAAHFAVTYAVVQWCSSRLAVLVMAALQRYPGKPLLPPPLSMADRAGQAVESILLFPIRGIGLHRIGHVAVPPVIFIATDSALWGIAFWFLILLRRRLRKHNMEHS